MKERYIEKKSKGGKEKVEKCIKIVVKPLKNAYSLGRGGGG